MPKILIADDEKSIRDFLGYCLKAQGYEVVSAENGSEALTLAASNVPDLFILDIMMPEMDGLEVCRALRADARFGRAPILILTAKSDELDTVFALDNGADDYMTKPFKSMELLARVKALLRRCSTDTSAPTNVVTLGNLRIDFSNYEVTIGKDLLTLTPKEFDLLKLFITNPRRTFTREELMDKVWGVDYCGDSRSIDTHIKNLRQKLTKDVRLSDALVTIRSIGYRLDI